MSNIHVWSKSDEQFIKDNFGEMSFVELASRFGVSPTCIRAKCLKMGLRSSHHGPVARVWSDENIAYLREHYPVETADDVARHLGISDSTVRVKAKSLGLVKAPGYSPEQFRYRYVKHYKDARYKNFKQAV